jgi:hypothetical protein
VGRVVKALLILSWCVVSGINASDAAASSDMSNRDYNLVAAVQKICKINRKILAFRYYSPTQEGMYLKVDQCEKGKYAVLLYMPWGELRMAEYATKDQAQVHLDELKRRMSIDKIPLMFHENGYAVTRVGGIGLPPVSFYPGIRCVFTSAEEENKEKIWDNLKSRYYSKKRLYKIEATSIEVISSLC